jgi:hypothetical protein
MLNTHFDHLCFHEVILDFVLFTINKAVQYVWLQSWLRALAPGEQKLGKSLHTHGKKMEKTSKYYVFAYFLWHFTSDLCIKW